MAKTRGQLKADRSKNATPFLKAKSALKDQSALLKLRPRTGLGVNPEPSHNESSTVTKKITRKLKKKSKPTLNLVHLTNTKSRFKPSPSMEEERWQKDINLELAEVPETVDNPSTDFLDGALFKKVLKPSLMNLMINTIERYEMQSQGNGPTIRSRRRALLHSSTDPFLSGQQLEEQMAVVEESYKLLKYAFVPDIVQEDDDFWNIDTFNFD